MRKYDLSEPDFDDYLDTKRPRPRRAQDRAQAGRRGRLTENEKARLALTREDELSDVDRPEFGDRRSTWDNAEHGPTPRPDWVITNLDAEDTELGILKTGKEADVFLLRRGIDVDGPSCVLAAKRYRAADHRLFHRDAQYLAGRRMRRSRENRAMAGRTSFGRNLIAEQWAVAEFAALGRLWSAGIPVPYPVQRDGTELLMEFVGSVDTADGITGIAAPRLAQLRPDPDELRRLWNELLHVLAAVAREGLTHGDLSAYNVLVYDGQPVLIDLPQAVDLAANPAGPEFLARDVRNVATWFAARGLPPEVNDPEPVVELLLAEANLG